jgi:hypothetical protein
MPLPTEPTNAPFFIIGAGRSGTTLLRLLLAGHSRLHIPAETWFLRPLVRELPLTGVLTPAQLERAVAIMTGDDRWPDMDMPTEDFRRSAARLTDPRLADIVSIVYHWQSALAGKPRCGDKTPVYFSIVPQLAVLYPGARFIHLIRDGRDVAVSRIDVGWERYYERDRFEWNLAIDARRHYLGLPLARQVLEIRYEDLVLDPERTVRHVCCFLGEEFEPAMLDWHSRRCLVPARERHIHRKLGQELSSAFVAAWYRRLSAPECFAVEACLHERLELLGYPLRFSGPRWRPLLRLGRGVLHASAPWLARGSRALKRNHLLPQRLCV